MEATSFVFFSCFVAFCAGFETAGICPADERYSSCIQCECRALNCNQKGQPITCPRFAEGFCQKGCMCVEGFLRAADGSCVPEDKCAAPQQPQCGQNEVLSCVQACPPQTTCRTRGIQYSCIQSVERCKHKCICKPNYYRNAIGECITGKECDQCRGQNEFFSCGSACDNECSMLATQNRTNCPIKNIMCNKKCYCDDGFARDDKKQCVPIEKCPKNETCKGPNEEYVSCKKTCPPELCRSLVSRYSCSAQPPCQPGCACKSGFFRVHKFSPCVHVCDCPEMRGSPNCTKKCG